MNEKSDIQKLLIEVDRQLTVPASLILIGGAAAIIAYGIDRATIDADSWNSIADELESAWKTAEALTGIRCTLSKASVADGPYNLESRIIPYDEITLRNLRLYIPEAHDLYLMKVMRLLKRDNSDIRTLCEKELIKEWILLNRFLNEMSHVVGDRKKLESNYLLTIEVNFGHAVYVRHKNALDKARN